MIRFPQAIFCFWISLCCQGASSSWWQEEGMKRKYYDEFRRKRVMMTMSFVSFTSLKPTTIVRYGSRYKFIFRLKTQKLLCGLFVCVFLFCWVCVAPFEFFSLFPLPLPTVHSIKTHKQKQPRTNYTLRISSCCCNMTRSRRLCFPIRNRPGCRPLFSSFNTCVCVCVWDVGVFVRPKKCCYSWQGGALFYFVVKIISPNIVLLE